MKEWWERLNERERWMVTAGAALTLLLLVYALVWQPFQNRLKGLRQAVAQQTADLAWMQQAAQEIKRLEQASSGAEKTSGSDRRSLLTLVDQTAKSAGLGSAVKRVEPQGEDKLRVQLEQVGFDKMIVWLGTLRQQHGVVATNVTVDRQGDSGEVNARLILQGIGS